MDDSFIELSSEKSANNSENNLNIANKKSDSMFNLGSHMAMINEKGESSAESTGKRDSVPRQLNFDDADGADMVNKKEPDRPKISLFSKIQTNETAKKLSDSITSRSSEASWKSKSSDAKSADSLITPLETVTIKHNTTATTKLIDAIAPEAKLCTELQTPKLKSSNSDGNKNQKPNTTEGEEETPYKSFQMPVTSTMRRMQTSSQHRTLLSSAGQSKKCRSDLENEFKSQKVLFRTPSAVSRPAMKVMNHLGLDDSLNCYRSSPMVNLSPVKEERNKSDTGTPNENQTKDEKVVKSGDAAINDTAKVGASANKTEEKKKIITINGKDFVIQNRIGQGGSSTVFLVEHKQTKVPCALKVS